MKRKLLALALAVCLMVSLLPQGILPARAYSDTDVPYAVEGGNIYFDKETGAITDCDKTVTKADIPAEIDGVAMTAIGSHAFSDCVSLTSVTIPNSVTTIGKQAFDSCTSLTSVTIADSVTTLDNFAFSGCSSLTSVTIGAGVTTIGAGTFDDCKSLTSVTIPNSVTTIGVQAFFRCSSLTSVTIGAGVTTIGDGTFGDCKSLTEIAIDEQNPNYSSDERGVLFDKAKTTLILAPEGISGAYTIPGSVTTVDDGAFSYCASLTSVTIPASVNTIGGSAFRGCTSLTNVTIGSSVTAIGKGVFKGCTSLTSIDVAVGNKTYCTKDGVLFTKDGMDLLCCPEGKTGFYEVPDGVEVVGESAFSDCTGLTSIALPDSLTEIGMWAFSDCSNLTTIHLPIGVASIGYRPFLGCTKLTSINVAEENESFCSKNGILFTKDEKALLICPQAKSGAYNIPSGVTSINADAFHDCGKLSCIVVPASVTEIGDTAFAVHTGWTGWPEESSALIGLTAVYFQGNAPQMGNYVFSAFPDAWNPRKNPNLTIYYVEGKDGWTTPTWYDYPTATWDGVNGPHIHSYQATVTAPTCTEKGYTTHACDCGDSYVDTYVDALGHDFKDGACTRCGEKAPTQTFPDVKEGVWYYDAVMHATSHGIFKGNTDGTFGPGNPMNRAMLVTTLHRLAGEPAPKAASTFSDVDAARYYAKPVAWAAENGIVNGMGDNKFQPNTNVTREQAATFLFRYAAYAKLNTEARADLSKFPDADKVSSFAKDSLSWANAEGLINGKKNTQTGEITLAPKGSATRAELAKILMSFMENVVK